MRASNSRSSASSSNSSVTIDGASRRAGANRGVADDPLDRRARPNAVAVAVAVVAATSGLDHARDQRNHGRTTARDPHVPRAITDPAGSVVRGRATGSARGRARTVTAAPGRRPPTESGPPVPRAPADGSHARIPGRGGVTAGRAASRRGERSAEDRGRGRAAARGIADGRGPTSPGEANDGAVGPGRGTEVESHGPSRAIAMVRSRHIDTGIEVRTRS